MKIQIQPLDIADVLRWVDIHEAAFTQTGDMHNIFYTKPLTTTAKETWAQNRINSMKDPTVHVIKAVDVDTTPPSILGVAKWQICEKERTEVDLQEDAKVPNIPPGVHENAFRGLFDALDRSKRKWIGYRPHVYLCSLVVDPQAQRKGLFNFRAEGAYMHTSQYEILILYS
jgi:hypothetical protein